jgi:tripartite ATP-independent transporter DctM subunit
MEMATFLISLFFFMIFSMPIAIVLALCAISLMVVMNMFDPEILSQQMVMGMNNFPLMAVLFFMLSGEIMSKGTLAIRIVNFAKILVGRFRGGLGYAAVLASMIFAGLSGSAVADAAALGSVLVPMMVQNGYRIERAVGLVCSAAILAPIIPPSIPMIVLGVTVDISISRLFMSGLIPGIMLGCALMATWWWIVRVDGYNDIRTFSREEVLKTIKDAGPALLLPLIIVGGIRFGVFTPTEAGAVAAVYAFVISVFLYRELNFGQITEVCVAAAKMTAIVMFVVASATAAGYMITMAQVPDQIVSVFEPLIDKPFLLLVVINIFLLILGMVMDLTPNILIFGPVLYPLILKAGIDPYYFGLLMILNLCIGLLTPPVGTILYLGCSLGKIEFGQVVRGVMPFVIVEIAVLFIYILFPKLVTVPLKWLMS